MNNYRQLASNGLWNNNAALVQLLGLCPLLAMSASAATALGMGLATTLILLSSNLLVSLIRYITPGEIRLPVFVMIIAASVTLLQLLMQAFGFALYQALGVFLPLITTNCIILGRAENFASKNPPLPAAIDGLLTGIGFAAVMLVLGIIRELLGTGQLFAGMDMLFGQAAKSWHITVWPDYPQFLVFILPPGAFLVLGFLIAGKNALDLRRQTRTPATTTDTQQRRVRVTGHIS